MRWLEGPIARGTLRTSTVLGMRLLVQAGTLLVVARLLGPQDFGAFAGVASLAVVLGSLSTFGLHLVLLGELSRDPARREEVLASALPVSLSLGTLLLAIFAAICFTALDGLVLPTSVLLAIGLAEVLIQPLLTLPVWELTARGQPARSQLLAVLPLALRLTLAVTVLWVAPDEPLMVFGHAYLCISLLTLVVISFGRLSPWLPPSRWRWPDRARWREAAGYALLNATAMGPAELDKTLAARLLPSPDAGLYAAAQRAVGSVTLPISAMMLSALPRLYREGGERSKSTSRLQAWIFAASAAYGLALAALVWTAAPAIEWLFGTSYHGIRETIHWLCLAVPAMTLRIATANILMAKGKPWMRVAMEVVGLLILFPSTIVLCRQWAATGMALAFACSQWTMVITGVVAFVARKQPHGNESRPDSNALSHAHHARFRD